MLMRQRFFLRDSGSPHPVMAVLVVLLLGACAAPAPVQPPRPSSQPLPEIVALFDTPPARFIDALPETCNARNQRVLRPSPGITECRMLMTPEATAGAILRYGGTISQLPETVIRLRLVEQGQGYLLGAATYLEVPQAGGGVLRVVYPDPVLDQRLRTALTELGGTLP
jgi:hypothetical protein